MIRSFIILFFFFFLLIRNISFTGLKSKFYDKTFNVEALKLKKKMLLGQNIFYNFFSSYIRGTILRNYYCKTLSTMIYYYTVLKREF